ITGEDIAQVSPLKERKDSSDFEDDHPASEGKVIVDATTPKRNRASKEKAENVVDEKKDKVTKKQRTQKK
ncbi:hypothetical protein A2U01_0112281, partial [Trifolium medium]|nr:hypothetical protein [Trifolium medium]